MDSTDFKVKYQLTGTAAQETFIPQYSMELIQVQVDLDGNRTLIPKYFATKKEVMDTVISGESSAGHYLITAFHSNVNKTELCCEESDLARTTRTKNREKAALAKQRKEGSLFGSTNDRQHQDEPEAPPPSSTDQEPIDVAHEDQLQRIFVLREGRYVEENASDQLEIVRKYCGKSFEELQEILDLNERPAAADLTQALRWCVEGEINGRLPRCFCGAPWVIASDGVYYICTSRNGIACNAYDTVQAPALGEWRTPVAPCDCPFLVTVRCSKLGFFLDLSASKFVHGGCIGRSRSSKSAVKGTVIRKIIAVDTSLSGKGAQQIATAAGAGHVHPRTVQRLIKDNSSDMNAAAERSRNQLHPFLLELCKQNRGTMAALITFNPATKKHRHLLFTGNGVQEYNMYDAQGPFHFVDPEWKPERVSDRVPTVQEQAEINSLLDQLHQTEVEYNAKRFELDNLQSEHSRYGSTVAPDGSNHVFRPPSMRRHMDMMKWYHDARMPILKKLEALGVSVSQPNPVAYDDSCLADEDDGQKTVVLVACAIVPGQNMVYARTIGANVFCIDGCHMKDGESTPGAKGQLLHITTTDGFNKNVLLGFSYCFGETIANYALLSRSSSSGASAFTGTFKVVESVEAGSSIGGRDVCLDNQHCDCGEWSHYKYPCRHVFAVFNALKDLSAADMVSMAFGKRFNWKLFKHVAEAEVFKIPSLETLARSTTSHVRPGRESEPDRKPPRGRPSKEARIPSIGETKRRKAVAKE